LRPAFYDPHAGLWPGHSQISLTLNTYSHVLPTLQRDTADRMNKLLVG
jgi:hypothetical protein